MKTNCVREFHSYNSLFRISMPYLKQKIVFGKKTIIYKFSDIVTVKLFETYLQFGFVESGSYAEQHFLCHRITFFQCFIIMYIIQLCYTFQVQSKNKKNLNNMWFMVILELIAFLIKSLLESI